MTKPAIWELGLGRTDQHLLTNQNRWGGRRHPHYSCSINFKSFKRRHKKKKSTCFHIWIWNLKWTRRETFRKKEPVRRKLELVRQQLRYGNLVWQQIPRATWCCLQRLDSSSWLLRQPGWLLIYINIPVRYVSFQDTLKRLSTWGFFFFFLVRPWTSYTANGNVGIIISTWDVYKGEQ